MSLRDWFLAPSPDADPRPAAGAASPWRTRRTSDRRAMDWAPPVHALAPARNEVVPAHTAVAGGHSAPAVLSAAVVGRPGEAEPMAAGVALALRRLSRARTAAVVVVGSDPPPPDAPEGGTPAARRLAARLAAQGFDATGRGLLAWTHVPPDLALRAAIAGAPAVLAIAAPLTSTLEAAIAEQDVAVVVTPDPDGPLAQLALPSLEHLAVPVVAAKPLPRGIARRLAHAGIRTPRAVIELLTAAPAVSLHGDGP